MIEICFTNKINKLSLDIESRERQIKDMEIDARNFRMRISDLENWVRELESEKKPLFERIDKLEAWDEINKRRLSEVTKNLKDALQCKEWLDSENAKLHEEMADLKNASTI